VTYYYKLEHVDNLNHSSTWGILTVNYNNLYLPILLR